MINKLRFLFVVTLFAAMAVVTNAQTSAANGNWSASATWAEVAAK